ncbi:MAG: hypothetical protein WCF48_19795 [Terriglobales bacterium]
MWQFALLTGSERAGTMKRMAFPLGVACLAALCGLLMSTLPYFAWYRVAHSTVWIADVDEIIYTEVASTAYYLHPWHLSDPTFVKGDQSVYSRLQLIPSELICKAFAVRPIRFGLVLRILGGVAIGFGWYSIIWQHVRRPWVALVGALFPLTDGGWMFMRPFIFQWHSLTSVLLSHATGLFAHSPHLHNEWRVISPVAVLPFLLLYLWLLRRSVEHFSRSRVIWSGLALGLLINDYFYFWTAAGLALILGLSLDPGRWRAYFHTGWVGVLVGTPELVRMLVTHHTQGSGWLQRVDMFLPIGRLSEQRPFLFSGALVVVLFVVVGRYFRNLIYLWCLCAAGFIMLHQQLFTGLQIQNFHWAYVFCPCVTLLLTLIVIDVVERLGTWSRVAGSLLIIAVVLNAVAGIYLRGVEAVQTTDSQFYSRGYSEYEAQRVLRAGTPLVAGASTAGDRDFAQYAIIVDHLTPLAAEYPVIWSPSVSDVDLDRRVALNAYLSGMSRAEYEAKERWDMDHLQYGAELRDLRVRAARFTSRMECFDQIVSDPSAVISRYSVKYVALLEGAPKPRALGSDWNLLQHGPTWEVWERRF